MSGLKDLAKGGWHPNKGKDGKSKESWRGDFKGVDQIAGWMGKGKKSQSQKEEEEHYSVPIQSLKDPSAFGPPPKNVNFHGGAALPNQITPDRGGWGAPLSYEEIEAKKRADEEEAQRKAEEEAKEAAKPPLPYRADRTGLSTSHLPPPPIRRDGADGRAPPLPPPSAKAKPPGLPPRLPPRVDSQSPPTYTKPTEPDAHRGILNQGALGRLGNAGVSVPEFGIGGKKSPLPPPSSTSSSRTSPQPAPSNASQLNELQSRFSRLSSAAPSSPSPSSPSQGTTFQQKRAAIQTASSFHKNPKSVSLSDARTAASTANNFRERHGEQVKSGLQSASSFNQKYGVANKISSLTGANQSQGNLQSSNETSGTCQGTTGYSINPVGKAKPPPPPKKRELVASPSPPPLPLASKPRPPMRSPSSQSNQQYMPKDLDLDLKSLWFASAPALFPPPCINRLPGKRSHASSSGWSSDGVRKTHTFTGAIRDNTTLATTKIHLTWDASNPGLTVKAEQRHLPPPPRLDPHELEDCRERYSDKVAAWCESKMGQQVGNGECWTLAHDALAAIGSQLSSRGQEPCMTSQSLVHGYQIYSFLPSQSPYPEPRGGVLEAGVARGDIVQLLSAHFKARNGMSEKWAGAPDHTAVVVGVDRDEVVRVVEQNVGGVKRVQNGSYDMGELVKGEVRIFRAVGEGWVGRLDATW